MSAGSLCPVSHLVFGFMTRHDGCRKENKQEKSKKTLIYLQITVPRLEIRRQTSHTQAHTESSAPSCSTTFRNVCSAKEDREKLQTKTDNLRQRATGERGSTQAVLNRAAVIYLTGADNIQACSLIALACLNSLCELSKKNHVNPALGALIAASQQVSHN